MLGQHTRLRSPRPVPWLPGIKSRAVRPYAGREIFIDREGSPDRVMESDEVKKAYLGIDVEIG